MECNSFTINEIVNKLVEKGLLDIANKKLAIESTIELLSDRIFIDWYVSDVIAHLETAYGNGCISESDAKKVLEYAVEEHDPCLGISTDILQIRAQELADEGEIVLSPGKFEDDQN